MLWPATQHLLRRWPFFLSRATEATVSQAREPDWPCPWPARGLPVAARGRGRGVAVELAGPSSVLGEPPPPLN